MAKKWDELSPTAIAHRVRSALDLALQEGLHREVNDPLRLTRLRLSGFPFCGLRWFLDLPRTTGKASFNGSAMKYFTHVGHVLHEVMQSGLASVDLKVIKTDLIGNWKCRSCSRLYKIQTRPARCKCGHEDFQHRETEIENGLIFGHIDTILQLTLKTPTKEYPKGIVWVVIDYKTTSLKVVNAKDYVLPYPDNMGQVRSYAGQLHEMGYPVLPLALLVYMPRDNPFRYVIEPVPVSFEAERKKAAVFLKRFIRITAVTTAADVHEEVRCRPCRDKLLNQFSKCGLREVCAGPDNTEIITSRLLDIHKRVAHKLPIIKNRPEE